MSRNQRRNLETRYPDLWRVAPIGSYKNHSIPALKRSSAGVQAKKDACLLGHDIRHDSAIVAARPQIADLERRSIGGNQL